MSVVYMQWSRCALPTERISNYAAKCKRFNKYHDEHQEEYEPGYDGAHDMQVTSQSIRCRHAHYVEISFGIRA